MEMIEPIKTIEELEEIKRKNPSQYYPPEPFRRVWHGDLQRLLATARAYLDPWIDVAERLPEVGVTVLCTFLTKLTDTDEAVCFGMRYDNSWVLSGPVSGGVDQARIARWAPLPPLPGRKS